MAQLRLILSDTARYKLMTEMNHSVETQIALLGKQIEANQTEINTKLDGMIALNNEQLIHMRQNIETNRVTTEKKIAEIEKYNNSLDERVTNIENKASKLEGFKIAIFAVGGALFTLFTTWLSGHLALFK
jgi:hypothetical protein